MSADQSPFVIPEGLLAHWQGHRRVSRRVIDAFPEDKLFSYSVGGMRPFGALAREMLMMAVPMVEGVISGNWATSSDREAVSKAEILRQWDDSTGKLNDLWPRIPPPRFLETMTAFGQFTAPLHDLILYVIDNEVHHRGQGYVYLRALGIEPPPFYDRS